MPDRPKRSLGNCRSLKSQDEHDYVQWHVVPSELPIKSGIKTLRLGWNKIRDEGVGYLADMLVVNDVLEELDIG